MTSAQRVPAEMFRFTQSDRAELYAAVLQVFADANEGLETALVLDDIRARVVRGGGWYEALSDDDFHTALSQLKDWQLLDVTQNHAENYRSAHEYERRNLQYALTRRGEAAIAGVEHALSVLSATGALQTAVLDAIADRLVGLEALLAEPGSSNRRIYAGLFELESHLEALRNNTKQFNAELQRLLRADGADTSTFHEVKAATVAYLQDFLGHLDQRAFAIRTSLQRIDGHGITELRHRALLGEDLPTLSGGTQHRLGWPTDAPAGRACWPGSHRRTAPHRAYNNCTSAAARLAETFHQVRQQLTERAELELSSDGDVQLSAGFDGVRIGAAELLTRLTADRDRGHEDITAAERDLFDKTVTGDTRRHLADRIRQAGELVARMNASLEQVRTASDVSVQLSWQVSKTLPLGTSAARELLLKDPVRLSDDDRARCTGSSGNGSQTRGKRTRRPAGRSSCPRSSTTPPGTSSSSRSTGAAVRAGRN